jgi:hypothetical protein
MPCSAEIIGWLLSKGGVKFKRCEMLKYCVVIEDWLYEISFKLLTMAPKGNEIDELSTSNRKAIFAMLLGSDENGKLKHGIKKKAATFFTVAPSMVGRIYDTVMQKIEFYHSAHNMFEEQLLLETNLEIAWKELPDEVFASDRVGSCENRDSLNHEEWKETT